MFLMQEMTMLKTKMQTMERHIDYLKNSKRRKVCTINITVGGLTIQHVQCIIVHMPPTKYTIHDTQLSLESLSSKESEEVEGDLQQGTVCEWTCVCFAQQLKVYNYYGLS